MFTKNDPQRVYRSYWQEFTQLKILTVYIRLYRDKSKKWVYIIKIVRWLSSSGGVAAWGSGYTSPLYCGSVIILAQTSEIFQDVIPFVKTYDALNKYLGIIYLLFIEASEDWEQIVAGKYTEDEILTKRFNIMKRLKEAEDKFFPEGLPQKESLYAPAKKKAEDYLRKISNFENSEVWSV